MKNIILFIMIMLLTVSANAVTVTCIDEGNNIVRIDYIASGTTDLPIAFALNITVDNSAVIQEIYDYKVGDSTTASPGYGIFPGNIQFDLTGQVTDWGSPDMKTASPGILPGIGTMGVTLVMNSRYSGQENAPLLTGTLCRLAINTGGTQTVNVRIAANTKAGGVLLANGTNAVFNGVGCVLNGLTTPPDPTAPVAPSVISYPDSDNDGSYVVQWSPSSGATSYQLERSSNGGSTWSQIYSNSGTSFSQNVSDGSYRYRVKAQNSVGSSGWTTGTWDCVVSTSTPPTETNIYEAENAVLSGAVVSTAVGGYSGDGFVDYVSRSDDYIEWTVNADSAGQYELRFYYGLAGGNRPLQVSVNGSVVAASLDFPATGNWTNWQYVSVTANLNSGVNKIKTTAVGSSGPNVDYLEIQAETTTPPPPPTTNSKYEAEDAVVNGAKTASDISGYSGTGFVDYVHQNDDYIEWTVNADSSGQYELKFCYALSFGDRPLDIRVNGSLVAANESFPSTGSWTNWQTVSVTANLNSGSNTIRATAAGSSGPNVDYLEIQADTTTTPPPTPANGTYEAEDAVLNNAEVSTAISGYSGTGFADYINSSGDYIEWNVNVSSAAQYQLIFRYGLGFGDRPLEVRVNGNVIAASQSFPSTGSWSNWGTVTVIATLNAGSNTIRATAIGSSGPNVDNLKVVLSTSTNSNTLEAPSSINYPQSSQSGSYNVSWTTSNGATSYQLERSTNQYQTEWVRVYSGVSNSYSEDITTGRYYYRVRALNSSDSTSWKTGEYYCSVYISTGYDDD